MSGNRTTLTVSEITAQIKGQIESQFSRVGYGEKSPTLNTILLVICILR
jgi:uncharacterized protein (UPF0333 family)